MKELPPVLVWHEDAERYALALSSRLSGVRVTAARPSASVGGAPAAGGDAEVLLAWELHSDALRYLPALAWIQVSGAGVDHFLSRPDLRSNVRLTRSLGRFGDQVAEYVIGYLLYHLLGIERYRSQQRSRRWRRGPRPLLRDRRVGVVGLGSLGRAIAARLAAFGAEVLGVRRRGGTVPDVDRVYSIHEWHEMLPRCEALVLAVPLTDETRGLVDRTALRRLPRGAVLINVARGPLVDEAAMLEHLRSGHLAAVVLDVFDREPLPPDDPLWSEPNAVLTPHIAAPSEVDTIADEFAENYRRYTTGRPLLNGVDRRRGY